jgi:hypothetical protein
VWALGGYRRLGVGPRGAFLLLVPAELISRVRGSRLIAASAQGVCELWPLVASWDPTLVPGHVHLVLSYEEGTVCAVVRATMEEELADRLRQTARAVARGFPVHWALCESMSVTDQVKSALVDGRRLDVPGHVELTTVTGLDRLLAGS